MVIQILLVPLMQWLKVLGMEAKIYRNNRVTDIKKTSSGEWKVITEKGDIICEHVVNAAGSFCPEVARGQRIINWSI